MPHLLGLQWDCCHHSTTPDLRTEPHMSLTCPGHGSCWWTHMHPSLRQTHSAPVTHPSAVCLPAVGSVSMFGGASAPASNDTAPAAAPPDAHAPALDIAVHATQLHYNRLDASPLPGLYGGPCVRQAYQHDRPSQPPLGALRNVPANCCATDEGGRRLRRPDAAAYPAARG